MAWRRIGDKPLFNRCWSYSLTHICGTRGRWVNHKYTRCFFLFSTRYMDASVYKHITLETKWHLHCRLYFQINFRVWKLSCFNSNFTGVYSQKSKLTIILYMSSQWLGTKTLHMNEKWINVQHISAHEPNHRDDTLRGSTQHVHGRIFGIFEHKLKTRKHIHNLKIPIVHSGNKEIDNGNWENHSITPGLWKVQWMIFIFEFSGCICRESFGMQGNGFKTSFGRYDWVPDTEYVNSLL